MSIDTTNLKYTINSFDANGTPNVTFACDNSTQNFPQCPTDTPENTTAFLDNYVQAYVAGLKVEQDASAVSSDVQALIGKQQTGN